ncbi:TetR/AcrR family transcriptional regulator [Psychromonas sp. 14N.309.X.WAT.B.A12]|uniref:TetR/AcrR family transcriptional regulator n=1 Tax=Psychromonas sp. 14N.309.X.WAT.B.A12 TaxID=2998322 RepID=UPI0025AF6851|nr:TetR/AcrR family transcriptional regulator [Psychromonas sp. 14N.309.X.WAT.B.A12]MDN2662521.1 TetR/AcrR family transcriptional regulator [Psychromonas sp. 14N.309.X.WAT.B.A12]
MQPRKQHLIDIALILFNKYGYHATGIDLILAESGVSKATLYKHFRSKEELILAALQLRHEQVVSKLKDKVEGNKQSPKNNDPVENVLVIFDNLSEWFNSETFFGCNFINVSAEYADSNHPINIFAAKHKQVIVDIIAAQLATKATDKATQKKADQIGLLVEGAIVMAHTRGMKQSALIAKEMARIILKTQP